jgi:hypothetical protein
MGRAWLARAQPALARIHRAEAGGSAASLSSSSLRSRQDVDRVGSADYVEARGFLLPATEYLERAVAAEGRVATAGGPALGTLLAMVSGVMHFSFRREGIYLPVFPPPGLLFSCNFC